MASLRLSDSSVSKSTCGPTRVQCVFHASCVGTKINLHLVIVFIYLNALVARIQSWRRFLCRYNGSMNTDHLT